MVQHDSSREERNERFMHPEHDVCMRVLKKTRLYYPCIETSQVELLPDQMCRDSSGKSIKRTVLYDIEQTEGDGDQCTITTIEFAK
jgi:hypothetical protein